jgi:hypothetical protein
MRQAFSSLFMFWKVNGVTGEALQHRLNGNEKGNKQEKTKSVNVSLITYRF